MIAILYESTEKEFTSNGLGGLPDAYNDDVHQKLNGEYELSFDYKISGFHYDLLAENRYVYISPEPNKEPQAFKIRRIVASTDKNSVTVYARHLSYEASAIPVRPFTATGASASLNGLKTNSMIANDFDFWTDVIGTQSFEVTEPTSVRNWLGGRTGSILDVFGGEYEWDMFHIKLHNNLGNDNGVSIRYSKNLKSLEQDRNVDSVYTGTVAYWKDANSDTLVIGEIAYITNHADYPHERILSYDATQDFKTAPTSSQLTERASTYNTANSVGVPKTSISVDYESLSQSDEYSNIYQLEKISLGDTVHVIYPKFNVAGTGKVNEVHYSWTKEKYKTINIGSVKASFSQAISNSVDSNLKPVTESFLEADRKRATSLLTGAYGGHFVIKYNNAGEPEETYWMDTGDTETATKVLRANYNGIGGSTNGINGPYGVSMTLDGHINADCITTGSLISLTINSGNGTFVVDSAGNMTATSGNIAGWKINSGSFSSGSGTNHIELINGTDSWGTTSDIAMYCGANKWDDAPFRLFKNGKLVASNTILNGTFTSINGPYKVYIADGKIEVRFGTVKADIKLDNNGDLFIGSDNLIKLLGKSGVEYYSTVTNGYKMLT